MLTAEQRAQISSNHKNDSNEDDNNGCHEQDEGNESNLYHNCNRQLSWMEVAMDARRGKEL